MMLLTLVALASAALTWLLGWWGIILAAVVAGHLSRTRRGASWRIALGASLAWALLLVIDAGAGSFAPLVRTLAGTMRLPAVVLVLLTLAFPAALGWSAAVVTATLSGWMGRYAGARSRARATSA
jgi:hypothetical protein